MDILITIAFLTLYYILGLGTVITLKTGLEEDVELEPIDYLMALFFPLDGCGISDTAICGVFGLDCAKDSEVGR